MSDVVLQYLKVILSDYKDKEGATSILISAESPTASKINSKACSGVVAEALMNFVTGEEN